MRRASPTAAQKAAARRKRETRDEQIDRLVRRIVRIVRRTPGIEIHVLYKKFPRDPDTQWDLLAAMDEVLGYRCKFVSDKRYSVVTRDGDVEVQKDKRGERHLVMRKQAETEQPVIERRLHVEWMRGNLP